MGFWAWLFGKGGGSDVVGEIGKIIDETFTSDEERLVAERLKEELKMRPQFNQHEINLKEAGHRSMFVAGWRPAIGWVCALGLLFPFIINPCIQWYTGQPGPELPTGDINALVMALLGLGTLRSVEKFQGKTK